ncbi:MAG: DUF5305 family protein [Halobacteriaceae archaeon]
MSGARLRYLLARRGGAVAVLLVVVGLAVLGVAGAMATNPATTQVTDTVSERTVETTPSVSATVTNDSAVYEPGTVLTDQPVYLLDASPNATLTLETALPSSAATATHRVAVVSAATTGGEEFWRRTASVPTVRTASDANVTTETRVDVSLVRERLRSYRKAFGDAATVTAALRVEVAYSLPERPDAGASGTPESGTGESGTLAATYPLTVGPTSYALDVESLSETHRETRTRTVTVPRESGVTPRHVAGLGGLVVLAGLLLGVVRLAGRFGSTDAARTAAHHARFAEWISAGRLPPDAGRVVAVDSLADLVDVGIDAGKRVVHDREAGAYAVLDGDVTYRFDPETSDR